MKQDIVQSFVYTRSNKPGAAIPSHDRAIPVGRLREDAVSAIREEVGCLQRRHASRGAKPGGSQAGHTPKVSTVTRAHHVTNGESQHTAVSTVRPTANQRRRKPHRADEEATD